MPKAASESNHSDLKDFALPPPQNPSHFSPVLAPTHMDLTRSNGSKSPVSQAFNQLSFVLFPIDKPQGKIVPPLQTSRYAIAKPIST